MSARLKEHALRVALKRAVDEALDAGLPKDRAEMAIAGTLIHLKAQGYRNGTSTTRTVD